jgi:hypothetical protein
LQIGSQVIGGSLAAVHVHFWTPDPVPTSMRNCIKLLSEYSLHVSDNYFENALLETKVTLPHTMEADQNWK